MAELLETAEDWVNEVWQRGNMDFAERLCAETYTDFTVPDSPDGDCASFVEAVSEIRRAFPDLQAQVEDSFQDQDFVILRTSFKGTHQSDYREFPPSGKQVQWESIDILHFRDDELIERFAQNDLLEELEASEGEFGELQAETERADLIGRLADVPRQVRQAIRTNGVHPERDGEPSTRAVVGHLWRTERKVWQAAIQQMQTEENPFWSDWMLDDVNAELDFGTSDLNVLLDGYEFLRNETVRYLRELSSTDWERVGTQAAYGELDVAGVMEKAFEHDGSHVTELAGAQL